MPLARGRVNPAAGGVRTGMYARAPLGRDAQRCEPYRIQAAEGTGLLSGDSAATAEASP